MIYNVILEIFLPRIVGIREKGGGTVVCKQLGPFWVILDFTQYQLMFLLEQWRVCCGNCD